MAHQSKATVIVAGVVCYVAGFSGLLGCGSDEPRSDRLQIQIDRTSLARKDSWPVEVASQTRAALERAVDEGVDRVDIVAIGSNAEQATVVASADLTEIEGNTDDKRDVARQALIDELLFAAAQVAGKPVDTIGTDVFSALDQAASLCHAPDVTECSVLLISDLEDQRVTGAPSAGQAITSLTSLMPDLTGIRVEVSGLGASGADAATVQKVKQTWLGLFEQAGAVDVRIARSLG